MKTRQHRSVLVGRVAGLRGLAHVVLLLIAVAYWFTQVVEGSSYRQLAEENRLRKLVIQAPRGLIYDRDGRSLVENVPSYNLLIDRSLSSDLESSLEFAARILARSTEELHSILDEHRRTPAFQPILLAEGLPLEKVARFGVEHLEHPEFEIEVEHLRLYRHAHQTAHVLGHLGEVSEADLRRVERPYRPGDLVGKRGIEGIYEDILRGEAGEQVVVVDSRGRLIEEYERNSARPGSELHLTLDLELQQEASRLLEGQVGAIVAMDPRNGDVLAMVSAPSFDPNQFARRLGRGEWQALLDNPHHPLQNRVVQNAYPPGSVFKIAMALAGLDQGIVHPDDPVLCRGATVLYSRRRRCWKPSGHGWVDLRGSIQHSCDIYFYALGQKLGIDSIAKYSRLLGLGKPTGIDLRGERPGLVPDTHWSSHVRKTRWYPGETISVAIGQGPILVTPLQVAVMTAAVANGGSLVTPRLVASGPPELDAPLPLPPESIVLVREALWSVVNGKNGTGASARLDGLEVAGKTGTVQVIRQETWTDSDTLAPEHRDHAWFSSFAPYDDPSLVVIVFVEHGGKGSRTAAPLARALYEKFFESELARRSAA